MAGAEKNCSGMAGSETPDGIEFIAGDGDYAIEVISGSRHQDRLEWLAQGRDEDPKDYACVAVLTHEPDNPFDSNAVSVSILGVRVGFLPRDVAADFVDAMEDWDFEQASCDAIVEGGWYRNADDKGDFFVRLDANPDFAPADTRIVSEARAGGAMMVAAEPRRSGFDIRSTAYGAVAMVTMLALLGVVWMVAQPFGEREEASHNSVVASLVQVPAPTVQGAARLASADMGRNAAPAPVSRGAAEVKQASATPTEPTVISTETRRSPTVASTPLGPAAEPPPVASVSGGARPEGAPALPTKEAGTVPAQKQATPAPPLVVGGIAKDHPVREMAAAEGSHRAEVPVSVTADHHVSLAVVPTRIVEEVRAAVEGTRVAAVLATPVANSATPIANEVPSPVTAAVSPPTPPTPPSRPDRPDSTENPAPSHPAAHAAKPEKKVRSSKRRSRFSRRSRASRSYQSRKTGRHHRRSRRAAQGQDTAPAPARSSNPGTDSQAARMLRGWTEEWTSASPLARTRSAQ
jgi:hypothetical protein